MENAIKSCLEKKNIEFIQLVPFLKSFFVKNFLIIYTPSEEDIRKEIKSYRLNNIVKVNNEILTGNLRLIGSYVPEKLAMLGFKTLNHTKTLSALIGTLSEEKFLYEPAKFARRVIEYRFVDLIVAFLFSDFFEKVWNGNSIYNRCFVIKQDSELNYYNFSEAKLLGKFIADNIIVKSKMVSEATNNFCINLHFEFALA